MGLIPNAITIAIVENTDTARLNPKPKICSIMFGFTPLFWIFYPAPPYQRRQISYMALTSLFQFCDIIPEPVKKRKSQTAKDSEHSAYQLSGILPQRTQRAQSANILKINLELCELSVLCG
jgi:hypothetical protein